MIRSINVSDRKNTVVLGKVTAVHGLRGQVKIFSWTQPVENIFSYKTIQILLQNGDSSPITLHQQPYSGKGMLAKIEGCHSREEAGKYINGTITTEKDALPKLQGEFYWYQLEQMCVFTSFDEKGPYYLGKVHHLIETGSNDVLVVHPCSGSIDQRERLIPWDDRVIHSVSLQEEVIKIEWDPQF